jgi:hypothetical protein
VYLVNWHFESWHRNSVLRFSLTPPCAKAKRSKAGMRLATAPIAIALVGCDQRSSYWTAFVYPNGADLNTHFEMNGFETFEQCQQGAINSIRGFGHGDRADYECGYKCEARASLGGISVCKETRK